jgi:formylglycine-generating enzyme required for sulfatase activity
MISNNFKYVYGRHTLSALSHTITNSRAGQAGQLNVGDTVLMVLAARAPTGVTITSPGWNLVAENSGVTRPGYTQKIYVYKRVATGTTTDNTIEFSVPADTPSIQQRVMVSVLVFGGNVEVSGLASGDDTTFCSPASMPTVTSIGNNESIIYGYHTVWTMTFDGRELPQSIKFFKADASIDNSLTLDEPNDTLLNRITLGIGDRGVNHLITTAHHNAPCFDNQNGNQAFRFSVLLPPIPSTTPTPTPTTTPTPTPNNTCDKKIIKVYIPGNIISPGGIRANNLQLRLAGPSCCGMSNIVNIPVPPIPPPPPEPTPNQCLTRGVDLYGHTAIVSYDPVNCSAGHNCNAAIFDLYINNILIGRANLNNLPFGGYKETILTINSNIITDENTIIELRCALGACHQGIGRVIIKDSSNNIVFASCLPNDIIVGIGNFICPTPTPTTTPTQTPTVTLTVTPTTTQSLTPTNTATPTSTITPTTTITISPTLTGTSTPTATPTQAAVAAGANSANYNNAADWNGQDGNVTTVGTNGGPSAYGTFDQTGNVFEWNDLAGDNGSSRGMRGGSWANLSASTMSNSIRFGLNPTDESHTYGFRLASSSNPLALAHFVTVGNAGNPNDTTGYGGVNYQYQIGKYCVTNSDYEDFLDAVAATDSYGLYGVNMGSDARGGITRSGSSGSYTYSTRANMCAKPVNFVSWFDAARYCNWLHNNYGSTETGAYTLNGATSGNAVAKNPGALYWIPTENEWYKAAYHKSGGLNTGYWAYATQSDDAPTPVAADATGNGPVATDYSCMEPNTPTNTPTPTATPTPTTTPTPTVTLTVTPTTTQSVTPTPTSTPAAAVPISPLSLANGFLSALRTDTISDSEFSNAVLTNGYLSVLRVNDTISDSEISNAALTNGYLSVLHIDPST